MSAGKALCRYFLTKAAMRLSVSRRLLLQAMCDELASQLRTAIQLYYDDLVLHGKIATSIGGRQSTPRMFFTIGAAMFLGEPGAVPNRVAEAAYNLWRFDPTNADCMCDPADATPKCTALQWTALDKKSRLVCALQTILPSEAFVQLEACTIAHLARQPDGLAHSIYQCLHTEKSSPLDDFCDAMKIPLNEKYYVVRWLTKHVGVVLGCVLASMAQFDAVRRLRGAGLLPDDPDEAETPVHSPSPRPPGRPRKNKQKAGEDDEEWFADLEKRGARVLKRVRAASEEERAASEEGGVACV